ncbi:4688_t:CDS:2 [Diversispora eburnea]|uniref:superoxide dismutase n=1 Tax=Diversispora eburnea TaxID=1213867 RepID=A0A9N8V931_9GLOM|nr:4688_t:CDS:2 [Diversispora eburnea]
MNCLSLPRVLKSSIGSATNFIGSGSRLLSHAGSAGFVISRSKFHLPDLPYDYNALEPIVSAEIMKVHHSKHHQTYVNNLNVAEEKFEKALKDNDVREQIALQSALKFNGGGHINHSLFWINLSPIKEGGGEPPKGQLLSAIQKEFGSLEDFISKFNSSTVAVQADYLKAIWEVVNWKIVAERFAEAQ